LLLAIVSRFTPTLLILAKSGPTKLAFGEAGAMYGRR